MAGFLAARILRINLSNRKRTIETLPGEVYRLFPGGSALAAYYLLKEMKPGVEPLSPENTLIFAVSPLTGLPVGGLSILVISAKSPLTGTIGDSQSGGYFPVHLKNNGWDAVIFEGKADQLTYVFIDGDNIELKSACNLRGKTTGEAENIIKNEVNDDKVEIVQIGPAGENLVKFACVMSGCHRANGRNGMGTVMGSKNLRAVVVKKSVVKCKPFDPEGFLQLTNGISEKVKNNPSMMGLQTDGTAGSLINYHKVGFVPTKNMQTGWFPEGSEKITGSVMTKTILKKNNACYACPVRCKRIVEIPGLVDPKYGGPEFETVCFLGAVCGNSNLETIAYANQLCNKYGLDTISCGSTIAFAMECFEKGILTIRETDGIDLRFGNESALITMIEKIAFRQGIGDLLADGSASAAKQIGGEAKNYSINVKGQELPAHMPQFKPAVALLYTVNSFGADHESCEHDSLLLSTEGSFVWNRLGQLGIWKRYDDYSLLDDERVRFAFDTQCMYSALDTLCMCHFVWGPAWQLYGPAEMVHLCKTGIGWDTSVFEIMRIGERRFNMLRLFNAREGFTRKDDKLPDRFFEPLPNGPSKGVHLDRDEFKKAIDLYYGMAGWNLETGNPTEATIRKLSLGWLLKDDKK